MGKPWYSSGFQTSNKVKMKLYRKQLSKPTTLNIDNYKKYRNGYNNLLKAAEKQHLLNIFEGCKKNIKETWSNINSFIGRGNKNKNFAFPKQFFMGDNCYSTNSDIVNGFNEYFINIGERLQK